VTTAARRILAVPLVVLLLTFLGIVSALVPPAQASGPEPGGTGPAARTNAASPKDKAAADAPLSLLNAVQVHGGYVSAGIGMRNLGYGTVTLAGIPAGSTIDGAYLLWNVINSSATAALAAGTFNGTAITGTTVATGSSPCWPSFAGESGYANFSYEANVTSLVTGNGSYTLAGFASGSTAGEDPFTVDSPFPEFEGASLVAVYENASSPETTVQIYGGAAETDSGNLLSQTLSGFTASSSPAAQTTFIVADGQSLPDDGGTFNGTQLVSNFTGSAPQAVPSYSQGNLWDNDTFDASSLVKQGDTSEMATVEGADDCLVWVGQVFSVTSSSLTHYELDLKLWIPQEKVVDPGNPTGTLPYLLWKGEVALGYEPDLSNPNPNIGPFMPGSNCEDPATALAAARTSVSSVLDGDNYTGYNDGTTYRAAATISFDWDGSSISDLAFTAEPSLSHRSITEVTETGSGEATRNCVEYHLGTAAVNAKTESPSTLDINMNGVVGFLTKQAVEAGAYPKNSWQVAVNPDGSLNISDTSSRFPTTGLKVLINGQVEATDIVNDASCYKPSSLLGLTAIARFLLLFHLNTTGSLPTITPGGPPTSVDRPSPSC
jgi:hypothetical protein